MTKQHKAFLCLVLGALLLSGVILYHSLAGKERSLTLLLQTYPWPIGLSLALFVGFWFFSRKK